jgi:two-component system sensor kinase FixL
MIRIEAFWDRKHKTRVLLAAGILLAIIALFDWVTKPYFALGFLYLFPIMLAAPFLPRWATTLLGLVCAFLAERFSYLNPSDANIRLAVLALAFCGCGLLLSEVRRNQVLDTESQEQIRILVETSPAAIVTIDGSGFIELANQAANQLLLPPEGNLVGQPVAGFLPELYRALRRNGSPQLRATMQCRGQRANGEPFLASVWFSTYNKGGDPKVAAIIADVGEDQNHQNGSQTGTPDRHARATLNARETDVLRLVCQGLSNKEIAAKMSISDSGVKNTLQQLFGKTEVRTRAQLVRVALEHYRDLL